MNRSLRKGGRGKEYILKFDVYLGHNVLIARHSLLFA